MSDELLTPLEQKVIEDLGNIWNDLCDIVGTELTRDSDLMEAIAHVHALQRTVMAQAAGRAYPSRFRLLGERQAGRIPNDRQP